MLQKADVYTHRLLTLADIFECGNRDGVKCDMSFYLSQCGTSACICGHAILLWGTTSDIKMLHSWVSEAHDEAGMSDVIGMTSDYILATGASLLGLDIQTAEELFVFYPVWHIPLPAEALAPAVLRHLAATGKVNWAIGDAS